MDSAASKFQHHSRKLLCCLTLLVLCPPSYAEETAQCPAAEACPGSAEASASWDLYLSGYAYHLRDTYSKERIKKLNEKAWGGGLGRTLRNGRGNDESLYVVAIRDSREHTQWMAGYAYQWIYPVVSEKVEVGVGVTVAAVKRDDWYSGHPFPAVLPVASIGTQDVKLVLTYVPRISSKGGKGKGNVALFMAKISF
jgi:palmitoyl transferase